MDRSRSAKLGVAALLFVTIAGFYWKLTLTNQYEWMRGPDLAEQVLPWFEVQAREIHAGRLPLWDRYLWSGQPLLGLAQPGTAYPLNWILFALPLKDGHIAPLALTWYYVVIHLMAAAFAYLFCRDLGRSRGASFAGGVIFSLAGYLGSVDWPQMINGAVWAPLVYLFQFRVERSGRPARDAALSGMFLGISFLSGHHQVPTLIALGWMGVWIYLCARNRRLIGPAALSLVLAGLCGALQILPAYEYGRLARRWVGAPAPVEWNQPVPYAVHEHYDLKAFSLLGIVFPDVKAHFDPFTGVAAFSLALLAVAAAWKDARVRVLGALGLGAILYALGHNTIFQGILYAIVPDLDKARSPSAMVVVFQLAVAALAAFGIDHLDSAWTRVTRWALVWFGVLTLSASVFVTVVNHVKLTLDGRFILTGVVALLMAALLYARPARGPVLMVLLLLFELGNYSQLQLAPRSDANQMHWLNQMRGEPELAAHIRAQAGFPRTEIAEDLFAPNWGAYHGVEMLGGYGASATVNVLDSEYFSLGGRQTWGVRYIIGTKPPAKETAKEVFATSSGLKLYERDAFPRAWAVHEMVAENPINKTGPEGFRRMAYMPGTPPRLESCDAASDSVELIERYADRLAIRANLACAGMVILSDTVFPGWRARVDHQPAQIYQVNGAMRGVAVPRGAHTVTMRYRPASVYLGAALTLLGVLISLALVTAARVAGSLKRAASIPRPESAQA